MQSIVDMVCVCACVCGCICVCVQCVDFISEVKEPILVAGGQKSLSVSKL